jgi:hypothetical protein
VCGRKFIGFVSFSELREVRFCRQSLCQNCGITPDSRCSSDVYDSLLSRSYRWEIRSVVHSTLVLGLFRRRQWRPVQWSTLALVRMLGSILDLVVARIRWTQNKGEQTVHCNSSKMYSTVVPAVQHGVVILLVVGCCQ